MKKSVIIIFFFFSGSVYAQIRLITGKIVDSASNEPLEFVNIYCMKSQIGDNTDSNGVFRLNVGPGGDTIVVSFMGYEKAVFGYAVPPDKRINIPLKKIHSDLEEVTVMGYRDLGKHVAEMVVKNKNNNNIARYKNEANKEYNKLTITLTNLDPDKKKGFFNNMSKVYASSLKDSSSTVAPLFFCEKFFLNYNSNLAGIESNIRTKVAQKDLGLPTDEISQKLDRFLISVNPYNSVLPILKTTFISPTSSAGLNLYKYKIIDTIVQNGENIIRLQFMPAHNGSNTFNGIVYIRESNWGIKYIDMVSSPDVNINYVNKIHIQQDYELTAVSSHKEETTQDSVWALKKNTTFLELKNGLDLLNLPVKTDSMDKSIEISSNSVYSDYHIDDATITADNFISRFHENPAHLAMGAMTNFKNSYRLEELSEPEQAIYKMADSLKKDPHFVNASRFSAFAATGFYDMGYYKLGQLTSIVSSNQIEGIRNRLGFWTTERLNQTFCLNGYLAYGMRDRKIKGGIGIKYVPSRLPYIQTAFYYRSDYDAIVEGDEIDKDNFFSMGLRKRHLPYLQEYTQSFKLTQEYDISNSFSTKLFAQYRTITPSFGYRYFDTDDQTHFNPKSTRTLSSISDAQIGIKIRYARNEKHAFVNFDKVRYGSTQPIITFNYIYGFEVNKKTLFNYHKVSIGVMQEINLPPKGKLFYDFTAGKVFGIIPSLLLHIPNGNSTYVASRYAFNNMQPYEYAADKYIQMLCVYNAGGVIFDKISLLRKFKLRERIITNVYWGTLSKANEFYNQSYPIKCTNRTPYIESGFGVGNILSLFYVDCLWRVTERNRKNTASNFGVYLGTKVSF